MQAFQVALITKTTINLALEVMAKYHLAYWDSLIIATALEHSCMMLYSEDLQDGQCIEAKITIVNPFKKLLHISAYPDGETGGIRTLNRKHPDTCRLI